MAKKKMELCINGCGSLATWVRSTQFSGVHPFCTKCAKKEKDFGQEDPSYFYWITLAEYNTPG